MVNHKILTSIMLIACVMLSECKKESSSSPTDSEILGNIVKPEIIDEYIYPVQPGTPGWANLQSHDEMIEAVKIPVTVLQKISTWGLVETCFKYPLGIDNIVQNCPSGWINDLSKSFNGLNELFGREDIAGILLYSYRFLDFDKWPSWGDWRYIELIFGCDEFVSKLNKRQLLYLVSVAIEKSQNQKDYFHSSLPPNSLYIMGNAMIYYGYKLFVDYCITQNILVSGEFIYWGINNNAMKIEEYANEFVHN